MKVKMMECVSTPVLYHFYTAIKSNLSRAAEAFTLQHLYSLLRSKARVSVGGKHLKGETLPHTHTHTYVSVPDE